MRRFEALSRQHDRAGFYCGVPALDTYLRKQARQNQDKGLSYCFVLSDASPPQGAGLVAGLAEGSSGPRPILGFYTLSACSIPLDQLPETLRKKLALQHIPAALIGRLAVSQSCQGQGLGRDLLMNAFENVAKSGLAAAVIVVDPKDTKAHAFYKRLGFEELEGANGRLFIPLATVRTLLADAP